MKISELFPSKYASAADLKGGRPTLTIARLVIESLKSDRGDEDKPVLYFKGATKGLVLNKTNGLIIAGLYGDETDGWIGKRITLYATRVKAFGKMADAIRVVPEVPPAPKPPTQTNGLAAPEPEPESLLSDPDDVLDHGSDADADEDVEFVDKRFNAPDPADRVPTGTSKPAASKRMADRLKEQPAYAG